MQHSSQLWGAMRTELLQLIDAAFDRIVHCAGQLTDTQLWWRPFDGANSIANQIIHLCGNLQQWLVDGISRTVSTRDRAAEFSVTDGKSREVLLSDLHRVLERVRRTLDDLSPESLTTIREIQGFSVTVLGAMFHSIPHLVGHAHQIMLMTRLQLAEQYQFHWTPDGDRSSVPL